MDGPRAIRLLETSWLVRILRGTERPNSPRPVLIPRKDESVSAPASSSAAGDVDAPVSLAAGDDPGSRQSNARTPAALGVRDRGVPFGAARGTRRTGLARDHGLALSTSVAVPSRPDDDARSSAGLRRPRGDNARTNPSDGADATWCLPFARTEAPPLVGVRKKTQFPIVTKPLRVRPRRTRPRSKLALDDENDSRIAPDQLRSGSPGRRRPAAHALLSIRP
jgi:hypothetical protein